MANWESLVGGQLGQFQIKDELGRGGMAVVYKGYQPSLDRWVAIKTLPQEFAGKREMVSRFHREAEAMVSLNHSNIVQIIDKGEDKGLYYFAMELVEGPSLQAMLKEQRSKDLMFDVAQQVAEGLDYAHKKGIVHRDIKPGNILWESATSLAKIADFGIARLTQKPEEMITLTAMNVGMGTMNYMAPEQKTDAATVDHRADIYSLGVMIYEMFTGTLPMGRFKMPSTLDPSLPKKLDEIVTRCMEPDPEERYASMGDLQADLSLARQQGGSDGTLVRSVRDAAERTLTALAGEEHKGKAGFACCLFIMIGLGAGSFVAYSKGMIPGVGPAEVATKTGKTKKTGKRTPDDDEKTGDETTGDEKTGDEKTGDEKTGDDPPPTKTGDDPPPSKTGDDPPPTKTGDDPPPTKTGDDPPPSKTGDDPPPSKTGDDPPPSKTGEDPPPSKTGEDPPPRKTGEDPPPTKTGGEETPPKPVVTKLDPAVQREFAGLTEQVGLLAKDVKKQQADWGLRSKKLKRTLSAAEEAAKAKPSRKAVRSLRDTTIPGLQRELAAALDRNLSKTIQEARSQDRPELKRAVGKADRDRKNARANPPVSQARACVAILKQLARERALSEQARAEAALAVARMRVGEQALQSGVSALNVAGTALSQGRPEEARAKFAAALTTFLKAAPEAPRSAVFKASGFPKRISNQKAEQFGSIAPAPGGRVFAVCKERKTSRLFLLRVSGKTLKEEWYAPLPANTFTVASAGMDLNRNHTVWVATQLTKQNNRITQLRFDDDGNPLGQGKVIETAEWVHDMVVGDDGQLYVLFNDRVEVYFQGRRVRKQTYDQSGFPQQLKVFPRRLAVLSDGRAVISGVLGKDEFIREVDSDFAPGWPKIELRTVYMPGGQRGKIATATHPIAITGLGTTLLAHDHGHLKSAARARHVLAFPQGERAFQLTRGVEDPQRPMLSTDMAYSNGVLYVLDHVLQPISGNPHGRGRLVAYTISGK